MISAKASGWCSTIHPEVRTNELVDTASRKWCDFIAIRCVNGPSTNLPSCCSLLVGAVDPALAAERVAEFHSIDNDTFAKLFRPKSVLCQKVLEVVIEQTR